MIEGHLYGDQQACDQIKLALMEAGKGNKEAAYGALTEALDLGAKKWARDL